MSLVLPLKLEDIFIAQSGMDPDRHSNSDASETSTDYNTYEEEDEGSLEARSRSATPSSRIDPEDSASLDALDESGRLSLSDDERIISSEEEDSATRLANREVEVTSGQSQSTSSAMISTAPSSMSCSGPPSPSVLQDPDVELAESVREALGLSGENTFSMLTEDEAAEVGDKVRKVLTHASDGALVPLLHGVLSTDEVKKLAALRGIHAEESQPLFRNVKIKKEEPTDSQSTDDIDERMVEAVADMTEIENWKKEQAIKEEPLSPSPEAPVQKAPSLDIDEVIYLSSDEENETTEQGQKIKQAEVTPNAVSESFEVETVDGFDAVIINEIKDGAHDALIDGILTGRKRSKRHNYFVKVINNERRGLNLLLDQISSKLVRLCSPSFLGVVHIEEFNRATREKLNERLEILALREEAKENSSVVDYYLTLCLQPELLINIVLKRWRTEKRKETYKCAELYYLDEMGDADLSRFLDQGGSDSDSVFKEGEDFIHDSPCKDGRSNRDSESVHAKKLRGNPELQPSTSGTSTGSSRIPGALIVRRQDRVERRAHTVQNTPF